MNVIEAVSLMIGLDADKTTKMIMENGRMEIEGLQVGLKRPMPALNEPSLMRTGRHVWLVTWSDPENFSAERLTQD